MCCAVERRVSLTLQRVFGALNFIGKVVALVGVTLAAGVPRWAFSPIKFQADMGMLLTFMLLWKMVDALILMPALASLLLQAKGDAAATGEPVTAQPSWLRVLVYNNWSQFILILTGGEDYRQHRPKAVRQDTNTIEKIIGCVRDNVGKSKTAKSA